MGIASGSLGALDELGLEIAQGEAVDLSAALEFEGDKAVREV